jgi:hypothetical protein
MFFIPFKLLIRSIAFLAVLLMDCNVEDRMDFVSQREEVIWSLNFNRSQVRERTFTNLIQCPFHGWGMEPVLFYSAAWERFILACNHRFYFDQVSLRVYIREKRKKLMDSDVRCFKNKHHTHKTHHTKLRRRACAGKICDDSFENQILCTATTVTDIAQR